MTQLKKEFHGNGPGTDRILNLLENEADTKSFNYASFMCKYMVRKVPEPTWLPLQDLWMSFDEI